MDTTATQHVKSHAAHRQSRNRKDPFLELPDDVLKQSAPASNDNENSGGSESLFADIVLTPIFMVSFIISFFVVERQQRQWRVSENAHQPRSTWEQWLSSPEPYQEAQGTMWRPHYSWKRRGIAKMQLNDVFELRGRVAASIAVWSILGLIGLAYAIRGMYFWLFW